MTRITIDTDCNSPGCPCQIVNDQDNRTLLVQSDWDYPGYATTFGMDLHTVQRCPKCQKTTIVPNVETGDSEAQPMFFHCSSDECDLITHPCCDHDGTDGTVDCKECGVTASEFISADYDFLTSNDGLTVEDPGYFSEDE